MTKIKLFVTLKIPDTTAITAFHTLKKLGFNKLDKLERADYYEFVVLKDIEKFQKEITDVDILVNANKHFAEIYEAEKVPKDENSIQVIVMDSGDNASSLFQLLRERMGFNDISEMKKGVLWKMHINGDNKKELAKKITQDLLHNKHYQEYELL